MLSKIREYLNLDKSSKNILDVGIVPYNNFLENFDKLNIVYKDIKEDIPNMDVCFVDNTISKDIISKIQEKTDILVSLGSCITFKANLVIPGVSVSDDFLEKVILAFINDDLEYLKPFFEMSRENDFRTKTILITVNNELCIGCSGCAFICPVEAIEMNNTRPQLEPALCVHCGCCFVICPKTWYLNEEVEAWC